MVLNISLNGPGEPIVESEEDAKKLFYESEIDCLMLGGRDL